MKIQAKTLTEFWEACGDRKAEMKKVDKFIREAMGVKPVLAEGGFLGYKMGLYKGCGKVSEWPLVSLAPQKNYMAIYACAVIDGAYINNKYKKDLGKVKCGKSCIKFTSFDDFHKPTLKKLLKESAKQKNPFAYEEVKN